MLNRVFNVVFNYSLGVFTAVSELCRRRHKTKSISRSQSLFNAIRFNLSRLSLGVLIACGLISEPTWAAGGFMVQNGKLVYCSDINANNDCNTTTSDTNLSSDTNNLLTWNGSGGFSTPSITLSGKVLGYKPSWATAAGGNTGLSFDGKPITPYFGVNSAADGGNYYGQGAVGAESIAIGKNASTAPATGTAIGGSIAIGNSAQAGNTSSAAIAIGENASANFASALAIGKSAKVTGTGGIAIGAAQNPNLAAQAGRDSLSLGYNTHTEEAYHSVAIGSNLRVKGQENIVMGSGKSSLSPNATSDSGVIFGYGNTVIGANNKLAGKYSTGQNVNNTATDYVDIANNMIFGSGNTITGTAANETNNTMNSASNPSADSWNLPYGAYKNLILGTGNTLKKNNYKNVLLATNSNLDVGANNNTLIGSGITVNTNITGSYVLGNDVTVTANNSVYFGDGAVASLRPTLSTVAAGDAGSTPSPATFTSLEGLSKEDREKVERYGITAGELGQTSATIAGIRYNFAGLGSTNGGVVTVGKLVYKPAQGSEGTTAYVPAHYETVGRIIQNVAPGLIGESSTDAINGSQLYAVMTAVNNAIGKVTSGESGPVVYTTADGKRVYKENGVFYDPAVTTVTEGDATVTYQQASNNLWYKSTDFNSEGLLNSDVTVNSGKTLAELNQNSDRTSRNLNVDPSSLVLSVVNAAKDIESTTKAEATKTLTALKNLKNALEVLDNTAATELYNQNKIAWASLSEADRATWREQAKEEDPRLNRDENGLSESEKEQLKAAVEAKAKELYEASIEWTALSKEQQQSWLAKISIKNAKEKLTALLGETDVRKLSQAVTLQDLQTVAWTGMDFAGDSGANVHRNLGETLTITGGQADPVKLTTLADQNIGVVANDNGTLNILLAKELTNLSSAQFGKTQTWGTQAGDRDVASLLNTPTSSDSLDYGYKGAVTKVDNTGIHLGYSDENQNTEKASFMLLNPVESLRDNSVAVSYEVINKQDGSKTTITNQVSPIFGTAGNGGIGTLKGSNLPTPPLEIAVVMMA